MAHRHEDWEDKFPPEKPHDPDHAGPPATVSDEDAPADEPSNFAAIRRVEYIGRLHHMTFRSLLSKDGLPPAQANAIKFIIQNPGMIQRELSDTLHIQRATTTVMLQKMQKAGLIERRPDPDDQRIYRIYPTPLAIALDSETRKRVDRYFSDCFSDFSEQDLEQFHNLLTRLINNIRSASVEFDAEPPKP